MRNPRRINLTLINDSNATLSLQEISLAKGRWRGEHRPHDFIDPGYEDGEEVGTYEHPFVSIWSTEGDSHSTTEGYLAYMIGQGGEAYLKIRWYSQRNGEAMCKLKLEGPIKERFIFKCDYHEGSEHRFEIRFRNKRC